MANLIPNANPRIYTLSAMLIGYALIDNFTANEQNAIGNWFMTIGQILECNAAFQQTMEDRIRGNSININSKQFKCGGSPYLHNEPLIKDDIKNMCNSKEDIEKLKEVLDIMKDVINKL